ncbi:MAG: hypothetical protein LBL90_00445 [Prevotellaceae bacterium]|jgi:hypothetical protein|nr:hypothetical protein [Prevotellaceae bacterium]
MKKIVLFALLVVVFAGCSKEDGKENQINKLSFEFPNSVKNGDEYDIQANIEPNTSEVNNIELFLDGKSVEKKFSQPFSFKLTLEDLLTGEHKLIMSATMKDGSVVSSAEKKFIFLVNLGDEYQNGVVIAVTDNGLHGTIAAKSDLTGGVLGKHKYGAYNGDYQAYSMNDGLENTNKFTGKFDSNYAAIACLNLELNGYDDWYLPAYNEMLLFENFLEKLNIPERSGRIYWSSTGDSSNEQRAYAVPFGVSFGTPCDMQGSYLVRPCRKF